MNRRLICGFALLSIVSRPVHAAPLPEPLLLSSAKDLTSLSLEQLGNIEVTSVSKTPEKFFTAPAAVFVITQDDIRRSGATSIPEALRMAPGLDVERINSNQWSIGVRGFGDRLARSVLVLMDGRAVYSPLFGGVYWEVQDYPLEDIDRIEVIRGPGGALWGANAVNGVINIITKKAKDTQGGLTTAGGGTQERAFGSMRYGGHSQDDSLNYRVYGKYFNRGPDFHADGNNFDAWQMGQGGFRTDWDVTSQDNLTMQGDLYGGRLGQNNVLASYSPPYSQSITDDADVSGANFLSRWDRKISAKSDFSLQLYYDRTNRLESDYREDRNTFDLDFQHHLFWLWDQELTWGAGYRLTSNLMDAPPTITFGNPANRVDHLANIFVQNQIPFLDVFRLTYGTKVEHNDYSGWEVEPDGRLAWTPTAKQTVWTAISRSVRTPTQGDQFFDVTIPSNGPAFLRLVGNSDFQPEKLTAYELGYRIQPVDPVFLDLSAFYNRYTDLRTGELGTPFVETTPTPHLIFPIIEDNKMNGETHGLEWDGTWNALSWWRWRASYSLLLIHLRLDPDSMDPSPRPAVTEGSSPRHQASMQWSMDLPHRFELDPALRYQDVQSELPVPPFWNLDIRLAWHATEKLELSLVGQNLIADHHPEATTEEQPVRGFYGKAAWQW